MAIISSSLMAKLTLNLIAIPRFGPRLGLLGSIATPLVCTRVHNWPRRGSESSCSYLIRQRPDPSSVTGRPMAIDVTMAMASRFPSFDCHGKNKVATAGRREYQNRRISDPSEFHSQLFIFVSRSSSPFMSHSVVVAHL